MIDVETIFDSDREEYEFMKEKKEQPMKEQIEEMANIIRCRAEQLPRCPHTTCSICKATELYNAGYRKQEWISVDDGLPEDGNYITYTNANGKDNGVIAQKLVTTTIRGKAVRRWEWMGRVSPFIVTHYMPLPEPPKMKGGAE